MGTNSKTMINRIHMHSQVFMISFLGMMVRVMFETISLELLIEYIDKFLKLDNFNQIGLTPIYQVIHTEKSKRR